MTPQTLSKLSERLNQGTSLSKGQLRRELQLFQSPIS